MPTRVLEKSCQKCALNSCGLSYLHTAERSSSQVKAALRAFGEVRRKGRSGGGGRQELSLLNSPQKPSPCTVISASPVLPLKATQRQRPLRPPGLGAYDHVVSPAEKGLMQLKSIGISCFALLSNYQSFFIFKKLITGELAKNAYGTPNPASCFGCGLSEYEFIYNAYPLPGMVGRTLHTLSSLIPVPPKEGGAVTPLSQRKSLP